MSTILRRRPVVTAAPNPSISPVDHQGRSILRRRTVTTNPAAVVQAPGVRRLRFATADNAASRLAKATVARTQIDNLLQSVAKTEAALDAAMAELQNEHAKIEDLMRANNITAHSNGVYKLGIEEQHSRMSRTIDPKRFRAQVIDKDFWACVEVSVTKAKALMTDRELDAVAVTTPAKSTGFHFKIKKLDTPKR